MSKLQRWPESNPALPPSAEWVDVSVSGFVYVERIARQPKWYLEVFWASSDSECLGRCKNIAACHSSLWRVHWRKGVPWLELVESHQ